MKVGDVIDSIYGKTLKILEVGHPQTYDFYATFTELWLYCEDLTGSLPPMWYKASELMAKKSSGCECGAKHDRSFPNHHQHYCPMHKD